MDDRYRVNRKGRHYVEHRTGDETEWCGPLIMSANHSRVGELPERVICICCGDFCRDVDADTVATVDRLEKRMDREDEAAGKRARAVEKVRSAGGVPAPTAKRIRSRRPVQTKMFG